ncbi:MAG TPA: hypothetical protein VMS37_13410 [Verrucomicrobiae bacterium]|nr:hypothetical protein [Verrucomicrobiae bacterium]
MSNQTLFQVVPACTILIGFLGVAVSLRSHRRQMYAQMYIEFSARFHDVLRTLPAQFWMSPGAEGQQMPPRNEELTKCCVQCFHIIADLYYLNRGGYITPGLWRPWRRAIKRAMQRPIMKREWLAVESNFDHDPDLCRFMRLLIAEGHGRMTHSRSPVAVARTRRLFRAVNSV